MMRCFYHFKDKTRKSKSQAKATSSLAPASVFLSNRAGTERSSGSVSAEQISNSSGSAYSKRGISDIYEEKAANLRVFEFGELRSATNDFSRLLKIGEGGFGSVYKGLIRSANGQRRTVVAVKKLNQNGLQGHKQWLTEVQFLGVLDHPNLVKLIGYCAVDGERGIQRLLVYEFMPNKSLEDHLFNKAYATLPWITRLGMALGAAQGLAYLHEGIETQVIYRDFKASNILLDKELKPKLSDFGLAREGPSADHTHVTTAIVGTHGYAAPDYVETGHLTIKSDVWSFGVVLFEILTGRRSLEWNRPRGEQLLLEWIKKFPVQGRKFYMVIDPRLRNEYSLTAARMTAKLANQCLLKNPKERPTMYEVVQGLKNAIQVSEAGDEADKHEHSSSDSDSKNWSEDAHASTTKSFQRRKSHLAKMGDSASVDSRRRFMTMQRPSRTKHA